MRLKFPSVPGTSLTSSNCSSTSLFTEAEITLERWLGWRRGRLAILICLYKNPRSSYFSPSSLDTSFIFSFISAIYFCNYSARSVFVIISSFRKSILYCIWLFEAFCLSNFCTCFSIFRAHSAYYSFDSLKTSCFSLFNYSSFLVVRARNLSIRSTSDSLRENSDSFCLILHQMSWVT